MTLTEAEIQELMRRKVAELEAEIDALEAKQSGKQQGDEAADLAAQEAAEIAAVPRSKTAAEARQAIRKKYGALRAERGEVRLTPEAQALQDQHEARDADLLGLPENRDSLGDLTVAYRRAKSRIARGDLIQLAKLKRAYRAEFARLGYQLNE